MSAQILDGRKTRDAIVPDLITRVKRLSSVPTLAIIQVGNRPDSSAFIRAKKAFAAKIGVTAKHTQVLETISQLDLMTIIEECNADPLINGIIVQLPLPLFLDRDAIIDTIDSEKDVDALTSTSVKRWLSGREDSLLPATARGIRQLLKQYDIDLFGKKVTVIGRSTLVGKPIVTMCLNENATVTICHSKTPDLAGLTMSADAIIVAAGKPGLITAGHVKEGQVVIDVGINTVAGEKLDDEIEGTKLVGDVDFESVKNIVAAITPVPGGVGPMTVLALFENLLDLYSS